jgi:hypothetical protein
LIHCIFNTICIGPFVFNCLRCDVVVCFFDIVKIVILLLKLSFHKVMKINWCNRIIGRQSCRALMNGYSAKVKRRWMDHLRTA